MRSLFRNAACLYLIWLACSCNFNSDKGNAANKSTAPDSLVKSNASTENFGKFFKRYQTDSAFQISRTVFPLKYSITGGEGESDTTKYISKDTIRFNKMFILNRDKMILKVTGGKSKANVRFQIADTGFENNFMFELKDRKWYLVSVVDNSD